MSDAVVVENLRKRYGRIHALDGISLAIPRGEIFGLLGANGAGKTTLIRALVGLARPDSGTLRVLGFDPVREARPLRREVGYMPQAPSLYQDLSPRQNVRFFGSAHALGDAEARVSEVMKFVELAGREHDPVHTLSGGMKQRVSLACALVHRPPLLLLDEPRRAWTRRCATFWAHFRRLGPRTTIFVSTHQLDDAVLRARGGDAERQAPCVRHTGGLLSAGTRWWRHAGGRTEGTIASTPEALAES